MTDRSHVQRWADLERQVREICAPAPDSPSYTTEQCRDCGVMFGRRTRRKRVFCPQCAAARSVSACQQMSGRYGEVYELAVRKQLQYWTA